MKKVVVALVVAGLILGFSTSGKAELVDRGNGMWYDTDYNITWYAYPKMANLYWDQAMAWAAGLSVNGITGWRLPSALNKDGSGPCLGMYCRMSEFGHLYYIELGNPGYPVEPSMGPFTTAQRFYYWTGTETDATHAVVFQTHSGDTIVGRKTVDTAFAWAVIEGDPAGPPPAPVVDPPAPVPPPPPVEDPPACPACPVCPTIPVISPVPVIPTLPVGIEIRQEVINPKSRGKIQVAILSTKTFDAFRQVDVGTLTFGRIGSEDSLAFCHRHPKDANHDQIKDLVCEFYTDVANFQCNDTEGFLVGNTIKGEPIEGKDSVKIRCEKPNKK